MNYFDPGGRYGRCDACGQKGLVRRYPQGWQMICERCRRKDNWLATAFMLFMYVVVPVVVVLALVF